MGEVSRSNRHQVVVIGSGFGGLFGTKALIQRCTLHKRRNLADHLPDKEQAWVDAKLVKAFGHPDPDIGLRNAKSLAGQLDKSYPGAAVSLRVRVGLPEAPRNRP